jgi:hypothetical protein
MAVPVNGMDRTESEVRPRPDWIGLGGAAATAGLNFALLHYGSGNSLISSLAFIVGACLFWTAFVVVRVRQNRAVLRVWGFRGDNLWRAARLPAVLCALGVLAFAAFGAVQGTLRLPAHAALQLLAYPIWGVIQQFLMLGVVVGNLERIRGLRHRKTLIVLLGAVLFGLVHVYDRRLVPVTFLLELLIIPLYLRDRNLWPLGVLHGWLGVFLYLWVLNRDLWLEYFG